MTAEELMVRSSIQLFQANKDKIRPSSFGSGCIINYLNRTFLISVSHVTNNDELSTFIETNQPPENDHSILKPVGNFIYYDLMNFSEEKILNDFEEFIQNEGQRLDFTFTEIKESIKLLQPSIDFGFLKIKEGGKAYLNLDTAVIPNKSEIYGFYGRVKHEYEGYHLKMTNTIKTNLKYHRSKEYFHIFLSPSKIKFKEDYEGCSGAPILDSQGQIVALACSVRVGSNMIYGFSIQQGMKLIKLAIDTKQI